nr:unnamed protein product [Digitaria exilis]
MWTLIPVNNWSLDGADDADTDARGRRRPLAGGLRGLEMRLRWEGLAFVVKGKGMEEQAAMAAAASIMAYSESSASNLPKKMTHGMAGRWFSARHARPALAQEQRARNPKTRPLCRAAFVGNPKFLREPEPPEQPETPKQPIVAFGPQPNCVYPRPRNPHVPFLNRTPRLRCPLPLPIPPPIRRCPPDQTARRTRFPDSSVAALQTVRARRCPPPPDHTHTDADAHQATASVLRPPPTCTSATRQKYPMEGAPPLSAPAPAPDYNAVQGAKASPAGKN